MIYCILNINNSQGNIMGGPNHLHELNRNDLALLLGHISALRTTSELLYRELKSHGLTLDEGDFSDRAAEKIEKSLSAATRKYPAFQYVYQTRKDSACGPYHNEVSRILQARFDS